MIPLISGFGSAPCSGSWASWFWSPRPLARFSSWGPNPGRRRASTSRRSWSRRKVHFFFVLFCYCINLNLGSTMKGILVLVRKVFRYLTWLAQYYGNLFYCKTVIFFCNSHFRRPQWKTHVSKFDIIFFQPTWSTICRHCRILSASFDPCLLNRCWLEKISVFSSQEIERRKRSKGGCDYE